MEQKVIFRDYQEQQAQDHNDIQTYTRRSLDHIALDLGTAERRFAGFTVTKTGQTEVQIGPGRFYDLFGVIYDRETTTTQSMIAYLAGAFTRWVLVSASGAEVETAVQERDYLIDVNTGATEPRAVAMTSTRLANLTFTPGTESGDPIKPAVPIGQVAVAYILVDPTQVVSVTMVMANRVTSTDALDMRTDVLEDFAAVMGPRVSALTADLADLRNQLKSLGNARLIEAIAQDLARVKASLRYNVTNAVDYQTDWFLDANYSNSSNTFALGYDARIEEGLRFGYANMTEFEISLFSANDPNAAFSNGLLLPKYTEVLRLATTTQDAPDSTLGIAQYGFQTMAMKTGAMSRSRLRYGDSNWVCSNSMRWNDTDFMGSINYMSNTYFNPVSQLYDTQTGVTSTRLTAVGAQIYGPAEPYGLIEGMAYEIARYDHYWLDTWSEPFLYAVTVDNTITGAFIAQSFMVPNDIWATSLRVYIAAKGGNADINVVITELNAGVPNPDRCLVQVVYAHANIIAGWNTITIPPTFLRKGAKYAVSLLSNANHTMGMVSGQKFLDGTFFYSTDGVFFQGDLTKDLMLQVWGAYFNNSQVTIEFAGINLDGGFRNVDIMASMWAPASAKIIFEVRPNGAGNWEPLVPDNAGALAVAPPLAQFRARFDGTRDMQGAIRLTGSRVRVWRPKTALTHVSSQLTTASGALTIKVTCVLEHFDETPHDHTCILKTGPTRAVTETPDAVTTTLLNLAAKRYERVYTFNVTPAITSFAIVQSGSTTSSQDLFHVAERTFLATST